MSTAAFLKRWPPLERVARATRGASLRLRHGRRDRSLLQQLHALNDVGARLAAVLERVDAFSLPQAAPQIRAIEQERDRLLSRPDVLPDDPSGAVTVQEACRASKHPRAAFLLHELVRAFQPASIVELGTNLGISTAYLAAARAAEPAGPLVTLEASSARLRVARQLHASLELSGIRYVEGYFAETLPPLLAELGSVPMAFVDGHHQKVPTLDYVRQLTRVMPPGSLCVLDDIRWSAGMEDAWQAVAQGPNVRLAVDLGSMGLVVVGPTPAPTPYVGPLVSLLA